MKYPKKASAISDRPLTVLETIHHAKELRKRKSWLVNNYTALAAILALRDSQPSTLYLSARDDTPEDMPVQVFKEISKEIKQRSGKKCSITMRFADSFYKTCGTRTDRERLQLIMANESFRIFRFYGHLDKGTIEELLEKSPSIRSLGLAIQNSTDAETISNLNLDTVTQLEFKNVSVSSDVAVEDLRPLNASFGEKNVYLTFPYLTDDWVDKNLRTATSEMPGDRCWSKAPRKYIGQTGHLVALYRTLWYLETRAEGKRQHL